MLAAIVLERFGMILESLFVMWAFLQFLEREPNLKRVANLYFVWATLLF